MRIGTSSRRRAQHCCLWNCILLKGHARSVEFKFGMLHIDLTNERFVILVGGPRFDDRLSRCRQVSGAFQHLDCGSVDAAD